ncbi:hypothetical protein Q4520_17670 [Alteromonas sp. 1_MG-2023]|uniref:hypothetical protein n=1 Tax=Alteromonas sp. 1_MG-2023 TaxID=3062669 RepID=UPI0026E36BE9|nr:hypothetical protein [Alteromonas sp. 1_MG-2023]MDO6477253.1 hypothetical protein [Alteromonas sp. 1_MG-2023]
MENWQAIIEAVKDPFSLSALVVLVLMMTLRIALTKVKALRGKHGFATTIYAITVIGLLALVIAVGSIGLKYYELYLDSSQKNEDKPLTRVEVESILQSDRGNIERCLSIYDKSYYYIDFIFTQGEDNAINVDILAGQETNSETEFLNPRLMKEEVKHYGGHEALRLKSTYRDRKLSVIAPDINGCILSTIKDEIGKYSLAHWEKGFIHRYITDAI